MLRWIMLPILLLASGARAGGDAEIVCNDAWYDFVEQKILTGDGQGHGPDKGSDEWKGVVEFRLGIRGQSGIPPRGSDDWCAYIDRLVREAP